MKFNRLTLLLASALVFAFGVVAFAQEHESKTVKTPKASTPSLTSSVQLGDRLVVIPSPEGYEEAASQFKVIKDRFTATEAPGNDMLFVHLPVSDCDLLRNGSNATYDQYTKISVFRAGRELNVTSAMMTAAVADLRKEAAKFPDPNNPTTQGMEKHVERALTEINSKQTKIDFSKPEVLGEFNAGNDVFSLLLLLTVKVNIGGVEASTPMLMSVSYVRVKERLIFVYVYRKLNSKADVEPVKQFTTKWTGSILAAN
ncbi:MAG TPA: hypothetical protein VLB87_04400 [Pyrinomonadaceae bacterium]|nr:hypothetical protein [Pyrinomonadaceae bacterium]